MAQCASNPRIDSSSAVNRCLNGEKPGQGPPALKGGSAEPAQAKSDSFSNESQAKMPALFDNADRSESKGYDSKNVVEAAIESGASERGKSRGGTRGGKPTQQSGNGAGLTVVPNRPAIIDSEIEKCDGNMELTKDLMGALIQRPKMAEKLLSKPPFRFLHDIVVEVIKTTGFAEGLYPESELDSANVDDKDKKIAFLQKIINLVGTHLSTLVEAKPIKIVAGQDPQLTNRFLQLLAIAATHMPNSASSVATVLESMGLSAPKQSSAPAPVEQPRAEVKPSRQVCY